jgi:hypothetical protein
LFRLLGSLLPPPAGLRSTLLWGSEARLGELFPGNAVEITPRHFNFRYRSAGHLVEVFRNVYGPTRPSRRSTKRRGRGWSRASWRCCGKRTVVAAAGWRCRPLIWRR